MRPFAQVMGLSLAGCLLAALPAFAQVTVSSVTPAAGSIYGGTAVTIAGTNFQNGATIAFGANNATGVTFVNSSQLTATTPSSTGFAEGPVNVTVTNPDNSNGSLPNGYTYDTPPLITSVSPTSGPNGGGNTVLINGLHFIDTPGPPTVTFGGVAATGVTYINNTQVQVVAPAGAGTVTILLTNADGQAGALPNGYTYTGSHPPPTITSISPTVGPTNGGQTVTIIGTNFVNGAVAAFGVNNATTTTFVSSTKLKAVTPPSTNNLEGTVNVTVTNPDNQSATLPQAYTYHLQPQITNVNPNNGPVAGGTPVVITGKFFRATPTVTFGSGTATNVVFVNNTQVNATTPPGPAGPVTVTVTDPDGLIATLPNGFTYTGSNPPPTITSVSPTVGPTIGGQTVTIIGTHFINGAVAAFGLNNATSTTFVSSTQLSAVTPPSTNNQEGTVNVTVTNPDQQADTLVQSYTYHLQPQITGVNPNNGPSSGGTPVVISGQFFRATPTVTFGSAAATNVVFVNNTKLNATTPPGPAGPVTVTVTDPDGLITSLPNGFTYNGTNPPPTVTSVSPNVGPTNGGQTVTVTGTNFIKGAVVAFRNNNAASTTFVSSTKLTAVTPPSTNNVEGAVTVFVTNPDQQVGALPSGYTYHLQPQITSIVPPSGPVGGGNQVNINGQYFRATPTVTFGANASSNVVFVNNTLLRVIVPQANGGGTVTVTVTDPDGLIATLPNGYTYTGGGGLSVTSVVPPTGVIAGGQTVTINGTGFVSGATSTFGTLSAATTFISSTQLSAVTPPAANGFGPVGVTVTNPNNNSFTLQNGFTYTKPPTFITMQLDDGQVGFNYSVQLAASGGTGPYSYSVTGGKLPTGLTLTPAGLLSGIPTGADGVYSVTLQVADSENPPATSSTTFKFNILFGFQSGPIPSTFFGMIVRGPTQWPEIPVGALGKGDLATWPFLEPTKGHFVWAALDQYLAAANQHGVDVYWSNTYTPPWAVPNSQQSSCFTYPGTTTPVCKAMVSNITDWRDFVNALIIHVNGKIHMYELWSEPDVQTEFSGTIQNMILLTNTMHDTLRAHAPTALIASPSSISSSWLKTYWELGGTLDVDVVSVHGFPNLAQDQAEAIAGFKTVPVKQLMLQFGLQNKPIWDTAGSWGGAGAITDPDMRAAFVGRSLIEHWSVGVPRMYWYGYDEPVYGTLFANGSLTPAGTAWQVVDGWLNGASMTQPCSMNGGTYFQATYTCQLTGSGGYQAEAVWDTTQTCSNGTCTYSSFTPNPIFVQYRDVAGNVVPITPGSKVNIGAKPILLENHTRQ